MEFRLLGGLEVVVEGRAVPLSDGKQKALVAALLLDRNRVVSADELIEELWGDEASAKAAGNLYALISRLRQKLGRDRLERHANGYLIRVGPDELDLDVFERLRDEAKSALAADRPEEASACLRRAFDLWRGPPLADFTYELWAANEIRRIEELGLVGREEWIEADLRAGRHALLVGELQALVAEHPLRETFRSQLMLALYRSGRQAEALEAFREARDTLHEELGLEPGPRLRELEQAILLQDPSLELPPAAKTGTEAGAFVRRPAGRRGRVVVGSVSAALAFAAAGAAIFLLDLGGANPTGATASKTLIAEPRPTARPSPHTGVVTRPASKKQGPAHSEPIRPRPRGNQFGATPVSSAAKHSATARQGGGSTPVQRPKQEAKPKPEPDPPPPPAKDPIVITDNFDDGVIDANVWNQFVGGTGLSIAEQNGRLEMTMDAGAAGNADGVLDAHYASQCRFVGDFDVRADYRLLDWSATTGVVVQLAAWFQGNAMSIGRESVAGDDGEGYTSTTPPGWSQRGASVDTSGSLRIQRVGEALTTYYRVGERWQRLYSFSRTINAPGGTGAPVIAMQAFSLDNMFGRRLVRVAFDNFSIVADERVCG